MRLSRAEHSEPDRTEDAVTVPADGIWSTLSAAGVPVAVVGPDTCIVWCNPGFADLAERSPSEVVGRAVGEVFGLHRSDRLPAGIEAAARGEVTLQRIEVEAVDWAGTKRSLALSASLTSAWPAPAHVVVIAENLTTERRGSRQQRETSIEAARRASEDGLTGLPNRITFDALLESSLRRASRSMVPLAVLSCDLDGFRMVNEKLGDAAGDELLQAVAARLSHTLRQNDILARFAGDEFIVVAEEVGDDEMAHQVARRLAAAISEPIVVAGVDVRIGVSIGFTLAGGHEKPADLLIEAERAMQGAKRAGKGRSMSLAQVIAGANESGPTAIDWNELARTARPLVEDDIATDVDTDEPEQHAPTE